MAKSRFPRSAVGAGANVAAGHSAEANAELRAHDAAERAYLRRMEEIGHLPAESEKIAVWGGTAGRAVVPSEEESQDVSEQTVTKQISDSDEQEYSLWSKSIGLNETVKTLAEYLDTMYNNSPRYSLIQHYAKDVDSGWISPLCGFENYERLYNRTQNEIVGQTAASGVVITGQSQHFLQRLVGTMRDPKIYREEHRLVSRSGVPFEDLLDAIKAGKARPERGNPNGRSQTIATDKCVLTIDPDTGIIIQCNLQ